MKLYVEREKKLYAAEECQKARAEGKSDAMIDSIRNLMDTLKLSAKQAMEALKIPAKEQKKYMAML